MRAPIPLLALICASLAVSVPASAQTPTPTPAPAASLRLLGQPVWHDASSRIGVRVEVTNDSTEDLSGFRLSVAAFDRVETRSELQTSYDLDPTVQVPSSSFPKDVGGSLGPGETTRVKINEPLSTLVTFQGAAPGVYPLTISVLDEGGLPLGAGITTAILFYPSEPEPRLNVVPVIALNDIPSRDPDGVFRSAPDAEPSLVEGIAPAGWLRSLVEVLQDRAERGLRLGIAPAPRLIEELADLANGFPLDTGADEPALINPSAEPAQNAASTLDGIRRLLGSRGIQPLLTPYAFPDLPELAEAGIHQVALQLNNAFAVLEALDAAFVRRWMFPPAGRLDTQSLAALQATARGTARRTFFSSEVLEQPLDPGLAGCPQDSPSFACPIEVQTLDARSAGYQTDPQLQQLLGALAQPGDERLDVQRVFAEIALIREELPGIGGRVIEITIPSTWRPRPNASRLFFKALATAPWINTLTPQQGLRAGVAPVSRVLVDPPRPAPLAPEEAYYEDVRDAADIVETLADIDAPPQLIERLRRNVLISYSRNWWTSPEAVERGGEYSSQSAAEARRHLSNISVVAAPETTFTSREGQIQVLLSNNNDYAVRVSIQLSSPDVVLEDEGVITQSFPPNKATAVALEAVARRSGIFPVEIRLLTPRTGEAITASSAISIRSTELNRVAVGITVGAFGFLIAFYLLRGVRRRRDATEPTST